MVFVYQTRSISIRQTTLPWERMPEFGEMTTDNGNLLSDNRSPTQFQAIVGNSKRGDFEGFKRSF
jgi:hypothetical protein